MKTPQQLNVLYSSDDNYAQHLGVSICSLLENNSDFDAVVIFVIDNDISAPNRDKLYSLVAKYANAKLVLISFAKWKEKLRLNMRWSISLSSYARLFVAEMLQQDVDRVLYLDCDMIICDSLAGLWSINLEGKVLAAVQDCIGAPTKAAVGVLPQTCYFNAGLLLINLTEWRNKKMGEKCLDFLDQHNGNVTHHDQGTLNGVLNGQFRKLPPQFNLMTINYIMDYDNMLAYFGDSSPFYTRAEIEAAKAKPVILHFTPSFTSRPWCRDCKHPLRRRYWSYLAMTPWVGAKPIRSSDKWYVKLINWKYRHFQRR